MQPSSQIEECPSLYLNDDQIGKDPVIFMWSRVLLNPYRSTARLPTRKPSPYSTEESVSIWFLMNAPSFFSNSVFAPFFEEVAVEEEDDDDAAEVDAALLVAPEMISDSSHMWDRT
jgi:hypothetical protein